MFDPSTYSATDDTSLFYPENAVTWTERNANAINNLLPAADKLTVAREKGAAAERLLVYTFRQTVCKDLAE